MNQCPFKKADAIASHAPAPSVSPSAPHYTMTGGPKGLPVLGMILDVIRDPLSLLMQNAVRYGDIIPINLPGMPSIQLNHPGLIRHVFIDNHKNYHKGKGYVRFEPALGKGLLTSNGEKWRRDRQAVQPIVKREIIEGYYFTVVNAVTEKYKQRWLALTENGPTEMDLTEEMGHLTMEVVLRTLLGKDQLDDKTVLSLFEAFHVVLAYLKRERLLPNVDFRKIFCAPVALRYQKALNHIHGTIRSFLTQYKRGELSDKHNMLALLIEAQKQDPQHFDDQNILDQAANMIFGGFETTATTMQWMFYLLDSRPDIMEKVRTDIVDHAPCTRTHDSSSLTFAAVNSMIYLDATLKETLRLYPPFWLTSRKSVDDDYFGDFKVRKGTVIVLPQLVMHRHPRFWEKPNAFIPERFLPENEVHIDPGLYFPFSQGPRKCIGYRFAEMEAKTIFAKLAPLFDIKVLNALGNNMDLGISIKLEQSLRVELSRL